MSETSKADSKDQRNYTKRVKEIMATVKDLLTEWNLLVSKLSPLSGELQKDFQKFIKMLHKVNIKSLKQEQQALPQISPREGNSSRPYAKELAAPKRTPARRAKSNIARSTSTIIGKQDQRLRTRHTQSFAPTESLADSDKQQSNPEAPLPEIDSEALLKSLENSYTTNENPPDNLLDTNLDSLLQGLPNEETLDKQSNESGKTKVKKKKTKKKTLDSSSKHKTKKTKD